MTKAEQESKDSHAEYEKKLAESGEGVHLPRSGEPGAPDHPDFPKVTPTPKKKPGEK
ncbi:MAG: hypothetical protein QOE26_2753 [Verrucomicrobiota bacterium]|jgi:hypothetical protein